MRISDGSSDVCSSDLCVKPEKDDHNHPGARDIADKLMASLGSMLLYWYHYAYNGKIIEVDESDEDSIGGHFLHLLHQEKPKASWVKAMHTSLVLYAEHEFNASTFTTRVVAGTGSDMYSAICGGIGALRGQIGRASGREKVWQCVWISGCA